MRKLIALCTLIVSILLTPLTQAGGWEDFNRTLSRFATGMGTLESSVNDARKGVGEVVTFGYDLLCMTRGNHPISCNTGNRLRQAQGNHQIRSFNSFSNTQINLDRRSTYTNYGRAVRNMPKDAHIRTQNPAMNFSYQQGGTYGRNTFVPQNRSSNTFAPSRQGGSNNYISNNSHNGKTPYPRRNGRCRNGYFASENDDGSWWCR